MAEVNEINGDVDHLEEHCVDENVETQRLRYAGQREPGVPGILQRKILSKYGTVRGVRHRVRVGIAAFSGGNEQAKAMAAKEEGKVVVYTTSMTAVRKRCEECRQVKKIFANMRVKIEERDVFMNANYQTELDERIGHVTTVPQVFISGQLVGGAAKVDELNETGELQKMVADFERLESNEQCELCGGHRFIACIQCSGSKKGVRNSFTVLRCTACNEAGLMKCPECNTPIEHS